MNTITVRVGRRPGPIRDIVLGDDRTVAMAIAAAGLSKEGVTVQVNGQEAQMDQVLYSGDQVHLLTPIRGNA